MSLCKSKTLNKIKININSPRFSKVNILALSPRIVKPKINYLNNNSNSLNKKFNSITSRTSRYSNDFIFRKRELVFNKSLEKNKTTFKYLNYTLFDKNKRTVYNRKNNTQKNIFKKKAESLFLTDNIIKANKSMFPFIKRGNSNTMELDNLDYNNNLINIYNFFNNKKGIIYNNYNNFVKKRKKLDLKLKNDKFFFQTFDIKRIKEKEYANKTLDKNEENKNNRNIIRKMKILERCKNKELTVLKSIDNINTLRDMKMQLNNKKEQIKIISENIKDKLDLYDNKIKDMKKNYNSFNNKFINKYDKYIRILYIKINMEKNVNDKLIEYMNSLKQMITNLKLKIKRFKNNLYELNKYVYMFICIKEKKMVLPNYYKIILENKIEEKKDELKKINKNEIERILNYKSNILELGPEYMLMQIKRFENENLDLLKRYNSLRDEIISLKNEKEELEHNEYISSINVSDKIIESKKNILLNLKKKYHKLNYNKKVLYFNLNIKDDNDDTINLKKNTLYSKTIKIVNDINEYIKYDFDKSKLFIKGNKISTIVLYNLTKLEILVNIFNSRIEEFKNKYPNKIVLFQTMVDKNRKIRKINEQKKLNELKDKYERNRIIEKNNKIIIPKHKILNYNMMSRNMNLKKNKTKKELKIETIYDYLSE